MSSNTVVIEEAVTTVVVGEEQTSVTVTEEAVSVLEVGTQGPTGPQGDTGATGATGPQGPQGDPGSGDLTYSQAFTVASSVTVTHNLGKYPSVMVIDSAGDEVEGAVEHTSANELVVTFAAAFSGTVYCN